MRAGWLHAAGWDFLAGFALVLGGRAVITVTGFLVAFIIGKLA